jgi:PAS domain S-box-containing protein
MLANESVRGRGERSIRAWLLILVFLAVLPGFLFSIFLSVKYADAERRVIEAERFDVARNAAFIIDRLIDRELAVLRTLAASAAFGSISSEWLARRLASLDGDSNISAVTLLDSNREVIATSQELTSFYAERVGDLFEVARSGTGAVSGFVEAPGGKPFVVLAVPMSRERGNTRVLTGTLPVEQLSEILSEAGLKPDWIAGIIDKRGVFLSRSFRASEFVGKPARPEVVDRAKSDELEGTFDNVTLEGVRVSNSFRRAQLSGWLAVIAVPETILLASLRRSWLMLTATGSALLIVTLLLSSLLGRKISGPILSLNTAIAAVINGEKYDFQNRGISELQKVGEAFDAASLAVQQQNRIQEALNASEVRLKLALDAGEIAIVEWNVKENKSYVSHHFYSLFDIPTDQSVTYEVFLSRLHPEDKARVVADHQRLLATGGRFKSDFRIRTRDGSVRYIYAKGEMLRDGNGEWGRLVGTNVDVTERINREDRIRLLMAELAHRTKNMLLVIQSMAKRTASSHNSVPEFVQSFIARTNAFSQSQDILLEREGKSASIVNLVRKQLEPFTDSDGRLQTSGADILLKSDAAQNIGLALHELATNASKYGALSGPVGEVLVEWGVTTAEPKAFHMSWRELGGPSVRSPKRHGFGHTVITMIARTALKAEVEYEFPAEGVHWSFRAPLDNIVASEPEVQPALQP